MRPLKIHQLRRLRLKISYQPKPPLPISSWEHYLLYNNTNHPTITVIDDFLHGILEFHLAFFAYLG